MAEERTETTKSMVDGIAKNVALEAGFNSWKDMGKPDTEEVDEEIGEGERNPNCINNSF